MDDLQIQRQWLKYRQSTWARLKFDVCQYLLFSSEKVKSWEVIVIVGIDP